VSARAREHLSPSAPAIASADPGAPNEPLLVGSGALTSPTEPPLVGNAATPGTANTGLLDADVGQGELVTVEQAHKVTGIEKRTLWRLIREGRLTAFGRRRSSTVSLEKVLLLAESFTKRERKRRTPLWPDVRARQIEALESVYQREFDEVEPQWRRLLKSMKLALWYYPAARLVIDTTKWRDANDPYAYVAGVTRREAERLGLADYEADELQVKPAEETTVEETLDYLGQDLSQGKSGVWHYRTPMDDDYGDAYDEVDERWFGLDRNQRMQIDWDAVAQVAGLDELETEVLKVRSVGLSRDWLLATSESEEERLDWQAASRRLSGKMGVVGTVLRGHLEKLLPESV